MALSKNQMKSVPGLTKFNDDWLASDEFKDWIIKIDKWTFSCRVCRTARSVKHDGIRGPRNHALTEKHVQCMKTDGMMINKAPINSYFVSVGSKLELQIAVAESVQTYHSIRHHHSYLSLDCGTKVILLYNLKNKFKIFTTPLPSTSTCLFYTPYKVKFLLSVSSRFSKQSFLTVIVSRR
jgi:hypothetical protein